MIKKLLSTFRFYLRYLFQKRFPLPISREEVGSIGFQDTYVLTNSPWYHDFTALGVTTPQMGGIYRQNQVEKQKFLFPLISQTLSVLSDEGGKNGLDLFCADGFYSLYALQEGARSIVGVDTDRKAIIQAQLMSKVLGYQELSHFIIEDVYAHSDRYDFCICAGGLYHLTDPKKLLTQLRTMISGPLVLQTVFSEANEDSDYFETPAPHLTWGSRFSWLYLLRMIEESGWTIIHKDRSQLSANEQPEDRGSGYFLLE